MTRNIPFNKPFVAGKELHYIGEAVTRGNISGDGYFTKRCSQLLEQRFGIRKVLLTPSCTAALEMAAMLYELGPGDEVIMPSFTFVSTANAFCRMGARPVFVDIRRDTLNLDETKLEGAITKRTRVICAVHYAGVACDMDAIMRIAQEHKVHVVEDAAQGVHAFCRGRALGSIAPLAAYSFHATKNYTCGEGGALCINDPRLIDRAEIIREKGTDRSKFIRGEVDKYSWIDIGSSYVPTEIACAFLYGQLEMLDPIAQRRREIYDLYQRELEPMAEQGRLSLPHVPRNAEINFHMFYILLEDKQTRDELMHDLRRQGISTTFHYVPLHTAPMGRRLSTGQARLPVTDDVSGRLLRLPFYYEITEADQRFVIEQIKTLLVRPSRGPGRE